MAFSSLAKFRRGRPLTNLPGLDALLTTVIQSLLLIGLWLILWRASVLMEYAPHASIWFPPAALTFAALLTMGPRALPALLFCCLVATWWVDQLYQSDLSLQTIWLSGWYFALAHCGAFGLGALLLRRIITRGEVDDLPQTIMWFLVIACLSSLAAAVFGAWGLIQAGTMASEDFASTWAPWWIGDMTAVIVLTPMFVGVLSWRYRQVDHALGDLNFQYRQAPLTGFMFKLVVLLLALAVTLLLGMWFPQNEVVFAAFFLVIPVMWIVYTESAIRTAACLAIFSLVIALGVNYLDAIDRAIIYQFAVCVIAASAYFGLAVPTLVARQEELRAQAFTDGLTRLHRRQYFFEQADDRIANLDEQSEPVSLVVMDLDNFKHTNDTFGHLAGDQVLLSVAQVINRHIGETDLAGRYGGDEFMLLLPERDSRAARNFAERLRHAIGELIVGDLPHTVSASFGVVEVSPGERIREAFERADGALLAAKRSGANCTQVVL